MAPVDEQWMRMALELAARGKGSTSPNPMVGAVVVKDGQVVGRGYHERAGLPHAEVHALREAGAAAQGADLYVTLEPCSHYGRTPPCVDAVISAGIRRVVAAMVDPNPLVAGKGLERLRQAGILTETGVLEQEAAELNAAFITYITKRRPHVIWKAAATLDGKMATRTGAARWITGEAARQLVHQVRSECDAIMVGSGTVLNDDPLLTARPAGRDETEVRQPIRIIADSRLRIPLTARCLSPALPGRAIVATTDDAPAAKAAALEAQGVQVWQAPAVNGKVDIAQLLADLAKMEISTLLLEGGPGLAGAFFDARLIDSCMIFVAPRFFGGANALPVLGGDGVATPAEAPALSRPKWRAVGDDLLVEGTITWPA